MKFNYIVSFIFFVIAYLIGVKKMYFLISGYNTSSKAEKEKVNIDRLAKTMSIYSLIIAILELLLAFLYQMGFKWSLEVSIYSMIIIILIMIIHAQKFDKKNFNEDGTKNINYKITVGLTSCILIVAMIIVIVAFNIKKI
ncbi:MAG: DUF3784 domain-containing protein [Clostridioides sp.]|jgi:hypothetical protein|nr:DUF3784 domain-containing protein [Clostridioides sp.]